MAISKQIKGITIEINGDTTNLGKALGAVEGKSKSAESELRKVNRALKDVDPNSTVLLQQKQDILNEAIEATSEKLRAVEDAQEQVKRKFASGEIDAGTYREFQRMVETTRKKLSDLETEAENVRDAQRSMGNNGADFAKGKLNDLSGEAKTTKQKIKDVGDEFNDAEDDARGFGGGLDAIHVAIGNLAASGVQSLGGAIKDFISDNQSAANNLAAKAGLTDEEMQQYSPVMEDIYKDNYGESLNDIADAMAVIKQTSGETDPSRLKEMVENAMTLRDVFGFEISEQMRAVNMLVDQFGVTADKAFNLITDGAQKGLNKNDDLLDTINEYSVHYKQQGYSAEEFFNSLLNGAESGTFSVDKLGDAVKEFGIRLKDTSTTTSDALAALGYSAGEDLKEIQDTKDTIADLEKKLKYAKMEQANFNEETSELTRLKNADKIEEYNESLKNAKSKLAALTSEAKNSGASVQNLQDRFAAGGSSARKAAKEVLDKLFAMDDQVAQNSIGVGLFGTMWEDLGADGVKALMNVSGEIGKTEDALQKVKDVKYNDISNELSGLGREFQSEILNPVIKDFLPDIKNGIKWLKDNLNNIKPTLITTGTIIGTTFAVSKVFGFAKAVKDTITDVKALGSTIKSHLSGEAIADVVSTAGLGTLIGGGIGLGIAGAVTWGVAEGLKNAAVTDEQTAKIAEAQEKLHDKIVANKEAWDETYNNFKSNALKTESEYGYYDELIAELDTIVDKNGKIKKGYEDRARTITTTLSNATGQEIKINKNDVIPSYNEVIEKIEETIQKKKALAVISAGEESYITAVQNEKTYSQQYQDAKAQYENALGRMAAIDAQLDRDYKYRAQHGTTGYNYEALQQEMSELQAEKSRLNGQIKQIKQNYLSTQSLWFETQSTIANYTEAQAAVASGNADKIEIATLKMTNNFKTAKTANKETLAQQVQDMKLYYEQLVAAVDSGDQTVTDDMVANAKVMLDLASQEYKKADNPMFTAGTEAGKQTVENYAAGAETSLVDVSPRILEAYSKKMDEIGGVLANDAYDQGYYVMEQFALGAQDEINGVTPIMRGAMAGAAAAGTEGIKKEWDIHSPSRVSRNLAKMFIRGLSFGVTDEKTGAIASFGTVGLQAVKTLKEQLNTLPVFDLNTRYTAAVQSGDVSPSMSGSKAININIDKFVNNTDRDIDALAHQISCAIERETAIKSRGMGW